MLAAECEVLGAAVELNHECELEHLMKRINPLVEVIEQVVDLPAEFEH